MERGADLERSAATARLPATVVGLGLVSLLTDASSEMIFPLLPAFLATLGASNAFIGLVEGAADLVALALAPWHVLAIRTLDRVGKGVRTSPRDALIAEVTGAYNLLAGLAALVGSTAFGAAWDRFGGGAAFAASGAIALAAAGLLLALVPAAPPPATARGR
jgi:hypothetical protein